MAENNKQTAEDFINLDELYYAEVLTDDETGCTFATPERFLPTAQLTKTTTANTTPTYYDGCVYRTINDEASDELKIVTPGIPLDILAKITGKVIDTASGAFLDSGEPETKSFALFARAEMSDNTHRYYVWHKVSFKVPDEDIVTRKETVEPKGQELTATAVRTTFKYDQGGVMKGIKRIIVDERDGKVDFDTWYDSVPVPGAIPVKSV